MKKRARVETRLSWKRVFLLLLMTLVGFVVVCFVGVVLLIVGYYIATLDDIAASKARDEAFAAEIRAVRENRQDWEYYENAELGFSLMLPPGGEVAVGGRWGDVEKIERAEFGVSRTHKVEVTALEKAPNDRVRISKIQVEMEREGAETWEVDGKTLHTYATKPASNADFTQLEFSENRKVDFLDGTELVMISDTRFRHHDAGSNDIFSFIVGDGSHYAWFHCDGPLLYICKSPTEAEREIYLLNMDILRTFAYLSSS